MTSLKARPYPTHYLGIDPSLRSTGVALITVEGDEVTQVSNTIKPDKGYTDVARLCDIRGKLVEWVNLNAPGTLMGCCYETASLNSVGRQIDLAELRGVLKVACVSFGIIPVGIEPNRLKKYGADSGSASKERMIKYAVKMGWEVKNDDEADAAHLSHLAYAIQRHATIPLRRKQLEVLSAMGITL